MKKQEPEEEKQSNEEALDHALVAGVQYLSVGHEEETKWIVEQHKADEQSVDVSLDDSDVGSVELPDASFEANHSGETSHHEDHLDHVEIKRKLLGPDLELERRGLDLQILLLGSGFVRVRHLNWVNVDLEQLVKKALAGSAADDAEIVALELRTRSKLAKPVFVEGFGEHSVFDRGVQMRLDFS